MSGKSASDLSAGAAASGVDALGLLAATGAFSGSAGAATGSLPTAAALTAADTSSDKWLAEYAASCAAYDAGIEKSGYDAAAVEGMTPAEFSAAEGESL